MDTYNKNITHIYSKLNRHMKSNMQEDISEIETYDGTYQGSAVLDGLRRNTEYLCSKKENQIFYDD